MRILIWTSVELRASYKTKAIEIFFVREMAGLIDDRQGGGIGNIQWRSQGRAW